MNDAAIEVISTPVDVAAEINAAYDEAHGLALLTRDTGRRACERVQYCGRLLEAVFKGQTKQWAIDWLEAKCPRISYATACRYIAVSHVRLKEEVSSIRQLYIAAGIISEPEAQPKPPAGGGEYLLYIQRTCQYFAKHDPSKLNGSARTDLKKQLQPLHDLYERL